MRRRLRCGGSHKCTPIGTERLYSTSFQECWQLQLTLQLFHLLHPALLNPPWVPLLQEPSSKRPACKSPSHTCFPDGEHLESSRVLRLMMELESQRGRMGIQKPIPSGFLTVSSADSCSASGTVSQLLVGEPQL